MNIINFKDITLNPYFATGLTGAKGSFSIRVYKY